MSLSAAGTLREREAKTDKIPTGEVELFVTELRVLSGAQTTPFEVRDGINVNDQLRLKYRYLDLRRPSMHEPIVLRHQDCQGGPRLLRRARILSRSRLPCSSSPRPRARAIISCPAVCSRGNFYALPQSPAAVQADFDARPALTATIQIARCFRDEDLRADRQPEFTQIDLEMTLCRSRTTSWP